MRHKRVLFFSSIIVITIFCGLGYAEAQQVLRQSANDPQIQMAEDLANRLTSGRQPAMSSDTIDIAKSLAVFTIIYDQNGKALVSTAQLDGKTPELPKGVFDYTTKHGQDRVTWQPKNNVRIALVVAPYKSNNSGFVAVGRSLREIEKREQHAFWLAVAAWLASLLLCFVTTRLLKRSGASNS